MDMDRIEELKKQDWSEIAPRFLHFVKSLARARGITYIPGGHSPEDVALICIEKLYTGERSWDPNGNIPLLDCLKGAARSLLSSKGFLRSERDRGVSYSDSEEALDVLTSEPEQTPPNDDTSPLVKGLYAEIEGIEELENAVAAIEVGYEKPRDIADAAGISRDRIHEVKRRLLRKADVVRKKLELEPDLEESGQ